MKYLNKRLFQVNIITEGSEKWFHLIHFNNSKLNFQTDDVQELVRYIYDLLEEEVMSC